MGTAGPRKVQVFSSEIVEDARLLLTQKTSEPVPQPASFMMGAVIRTLLPLLVELRRKGYSLTHLLAEKGIKISPTALSGYMAKLSGPVEESPVRRARRERPQTSTSASQTRRTFCNEAGRDAVRRMRCMERILFVTGGAGGVGLETLQHQGTLRNSNGGSSDVLNSSLMRAAMMFPPTDKLHNILLANRTDVIPGENSITVQGISGKSQTVGSRGAKFPRLVWRQIRQRLCSVDLVNRAKFKFNSTNEGIVCRERF